MKQKQKQNKERIFEMNGGYYIDGVPYMDCKITGDPVRNECGSEISYRQ